MDTMIYTDKDDFISIQLERVLVEFTQDGDSECYPNSWTYGIWFDGEHIEGTSDEMSYEDAVIAVEDALVRMIDEVDEAVYQMARNNIYHARQECVDMVNQSDLEAKIEGLEWLVHSYKKENTKLQELVRDMYACISHANEQDWFHFERDKLGCGMSCTVNGEVCGLCALADRMRELGIEV